MNMNRKNLLIVLFTILMCSDLIAQNYCIPYRFTDNYYFRSRDIQHDKDIVYGQALNYKGDITTVDLDIFYPKFSVDSLKLRPLIMLIHGGIGSQDKTQMYKYCPLFAQRGFVVATINVRDEYERNPDENSVISGAYSTLQDSHAALRFLVSNSKEFGIDTSAIFVGGTSHGAVQSTALAYINQQDLNKRFPLITEPLGRFDNSTNDIKTTFTIRGVLDMWGQILDTSLISSEEAQNIPIIMFHGTADSSRSTYDKSVLIAKRFQHLGGCYQFHTKTGAGHGENMTKYYVAAKTGCFIKRILCGSCISLEREIDNEDLTCDKVLAIDEPSFMRSGIKLDQSLFTQYVGEYRFVDEDGNKQVLFIHSESDQLVLQDKDSGFKVELFPESEKDFFIKEDNIQVTFNKDKKDKVKGLTLFIDAKVIYAKKKK